jgi:hypothetical protein
MWLFPGRAPALTPLPQGPPSHERWPGRHLGRRSRSWPRRSWPSQRPPPLTLRLLEASQSRPRRAQASTPVSLTRWRLLRQQSRRWWLGLPLSGGWPRGTPARTPRSPRHQPPPPGPRRAASLAESALHEVCTPRGHVSDLMTRGSAANKERISGVPREDHKIENLTFEQEN